MAMIPSPDDRGGLLPTQATLKTMLELGDQLFRSGLMPQHIKSAAAVVAIIQKGRELGVPPMHALSNVFVIGGKPSCNAELMLALIYRDHGDDAIRFLETTNERCRIAYKRRTWREPSEYAFTIQDAQKAGLRDGNWTKYPAAMLRARCISAVARMGFSDTIGGMHTPDEIGAQVEVDEHGQMTVITEPAPAIEGQSRPAPQPPTPSIAHPQKAQRAGRGDEVISRDKAGGLLRAAAALGWEVEAVQKAAQDIYGAPVEGLTVKQAYVFHNALAGDLIQYDEQGKARIVEPPVEGQPEPAEAQGVTA